MKLNYIVKAHDTYKTIDDILINEFNFSTRLLSKIKRNKYVFLNNICTDTRSSIKENDTITIELSSDEDNSNIIPTKMHLEIIYEDEWFLIVNKPAKIATHPSSMHFNNSLSNGVCYYFSKIHLNKKIRPVNRLDLNTSGLIVFAKCEYIQECFSKQMTENKFKKEYLCLVEGHLDNKIGTINLPIARKSGSIIERCISENGQKSITHYEVQKEFKTYSLVKCKLETGRTHQIRVHMSSIRHPLLGDTLYGNSSNLIDRQALHCYHLHFIHPINKTELDFICEPPQDFKKLM